VKDYWREIYYLQLYHYLSRIEEMRERERGLERERLQQMR